MVKIQIVILKPEGAIHAQCFAELAETLSVACSELGYESSWGYNKFDTEATNIVFGWHQSSQQRFPNGSIIFNLEQLAEPNKNLINRLVALQYRHTIWDYSQKNIDILNKTGTIAPIELIKIGYVPQITRIQPAENQDIDVLFYGSMNDRRQKILQALADTGLKVHYAFRVYGNDRDSLIERAKIVLNVHFYDTHIFEIIRVSHLLANGKAVVAEVGPDCEIEPDIKSSVMAVPYDGLVNACLTLIENPNLRKAYEFDGLRTMKARPQTNFIREPLERFQIPREPVRLKKINLGSGKDWRPDCVNIDSNPDWNPDLVMDITQPLVFKKGHFSEIIANDVLEHLPDLSQAMTNCLNLLENGGKMLINVPYDLSLGAWQDPTHVRAFNEMSWTYYTDWYWYMKWESARFEMLGLKYGLSKYGETLIAQGIPQEELTRYPRAIDSMQVALKKRPLTLREKIAANQFYGKSRENCFPIPPDWCDIPVFIINRNRYQTLRVMVEWLTDIGMRNISIIDNDSTYQPLLYYYQRLGGNVKLRLMGENAGPWVIWDKDLIAGIDIPYIVTDADLLPSNCPPGLIPKMLDALVKYPECGKVGVSLRIDDLPDDYIHKSQVIEWESRYWQSQIEPGLFEAAVDTTFAMYVPSAPFENGPHNLRLAPPYCFQHQPWYVSESSLSEEERYYRDHTDKRFSYWSSPDATMRSTLPIQAVPVEGKLWQG